MNKQKTSYKKMLIVGVILVLLVAIGAAIALLFMGRMAVVWKQPEDKVAIVAPRVCDDGVVATYNDVSEYRQRNGKEESTNDAQGLKKLAAEVKNKKGYEQDPTCQAIVFMEAIDSNDYTTAQVAYEALKNLHDENKYADSNLGSDGLFSTYGSLLNEISPSSKPGSKEGSAGGQ